MHCVAASSNAITWRYRKLRRRLTFKGVDTVLTELEKKLYNNIFIPGQRTDLTKKEILQTLEQIRETLIYQHNGLFLNLVNSLISKVHVFGLHFAALDIRQESSIHTKILDKIAATTDALGKDYSSLSREEKIKVLAKLKQPLENIEFDDELTKDTLETVGAVKLIQQYNGAEGCNRYIISQCNSALNAMEVYGIVHFERLEKRPN